LKIFCFLRAKENNDISFFTIWSIIISFIITSIVKIFDGLIFSRHSLWLVSEIIICIIIACISAFLIYRLLEFKAFSKLIENVTRKSINSDVWRDIIDHDKGTALKIYLKNQAVSYTGKLWVREEKGNDSWIVIVDYICNYIDDNKEFNGIEFFKSTAVAINLREVERIELFYEKDTKIFE